MTAWRFAAWVAIVLCLVARSLAAAEPFDVCDDVWPNPADPWPAARCYYGQARATGQVAAGVRHVDALLTVHSNDGWLRCARGHLALAMGDAGAQTHYRHAVEIFAAQEDHAGALLALKSWHYALVQQGRLADAADVVASARALAPHLSTDAQRAEVDFLEASQLSRSGGDLVSAQRLLVSAVAALKDEGDAQLRAVHLLATVSRDIGHRVAAETNYQRLDALGTEHDQPWARAAARLGLALMRIEVLEQRPTAASRDELVGLFEQALAAAEASGNRSASLHAHRLLGDLGSGPAAAEHHRQCLALATATDVVAGSACRRSVARRLVATEPEEAWRLLDEALALNPGMQEQSRVWFERSVLGWRSEPADAAWATSLRALDSIETMRQAQHDDGGRAKIFSLWLEPYYQVVGALLDGERVGSKARARAFEVSERIRARVLLETVRWVASESEAETRPVEPSCPPVRLSALQAALAPDEAVLSYLLNNAVDLVGRPSGGSWLIAVTHDDVRTYPLPERMRLAPAIEVTLGLIPRRDRSAHAALGQLHQQLLTPVLRDLPATIERLTVVADGALHALPFAALVPRVGGAPVGTWVAVSYAPSASFLVCQRQQANGRSAIRRDVLVLADPAIASGTGLGRLPHTRREARAVRRHWGAGVQVAWGDDAHEAALREMEPGRFGVVHVAAHAVVDSVHPDRSAVLLTPGEQDDGRLEPHEILDLDLRGAVVVLSACRSAGGAISSGEGVMSLARSFFQAGASAVVGGLWALDDADTADLMTHFYRGLAAGHTIRHALAEAQRALIEAGAPVASWAGLVVLGDAERSFGVSSAPSDGAGFRRAWPVWVLLIVGVLGLVAWRRPFA